MAHTDLKIKISANIMNVHMLMHLSMLSLWGGGGGGGGGWAYVGHLTSFPTMGPQNWVKSDQISPPWGSNIH